MPYSRKLEKGLWEVRSSISDGRIARVLFTIQENQMILLHGFIKKTQTTPDKEKDTARKRMTKGLMEQIKMVDKKNIGSSFDDFLAQDGLLEPCEEQALKEILADQITQAMQSEGLTKAAMARRMKTSRQALDRLLDPANTSVTLHTMQRAAQAVGRRLTLELN